MSSVTGTDALSWPSGADAGLAGVRRLALLGEEATDSEAVLRALARELLRTPGGDEVHIHHLAAGAEVTTELVTVYVFEGEGRLSYLLGREERPPGVNWVASKGQSLLAAEEHELATALPRLAASGSPNSALLLALAGRGEVEAVVMLVRRSPEPLDGRSVELAGTLVDQAASALALLRARAEAGTDPVAGCMNHRAMRRRLDEEIGRAARSGSPLSCLLLDLDDFKLVNDRHGHQAGDALLRAVVRVLVGEFRAFDRVARYGGDEFVVILPNADLQAAAAAAARALESLHAIRAFDADPGVSASIGVAEWHVPMSTDELIEACDVALLRSKRQGKGRVSAAAESAR